MRIPSALLTLPLPLLLSLPISSANPFPHRVQKEEYTGYLLSTFTDVEPSVFQYLSPASDPLAFTPLNGGSPILDSTIGTGGTRDIFLTTNPQRTEFFIIATDLDINADGFSWDEATRRGSRGFVVWRSEDLVNWGEGWLATVEQETAGMAWAPSVVYNETESQYYLFWASRLYSESDTNHDATATLDRIRYATTTDFVTFSEPADYLALDNENVPLIDQEFLYLGSEGRYARFLKDENVLHVYQETTTDGIFGTWTRSPSAGDSGYIATSVFEGPAAFADVNVEGRYYLLMDNYEEYVAFVTEDVGGGIWEELGREASGLPAGLKHGNVVPVTEVEYEALLEAYGS
ncbi:glycoside hydrolase family 43 protein [Aspergillus undulatus]|uniref:glycoside hydrolase family 43 protein n=1 Tax=Aspergillus undulatus TaxID=1810928 RepID=UPI003CCDF01B